MSELEKLIESNATAISALTSDLGKMKRDRDHINRADNKDLNAKR